MRVSHFIEMLSLEDKLIDFQYWGDTEAVRKRIKNKYHAGVEKIIHAQGRDWFPSAYLLSRDNHIFVYNLFFTDPNDPSNSKWRYHFYLQDVRKLPE